MGQERVGKYVRAILRLNKRMHPTNPDQLDQTLSARFTLRETAIDRPKKLMKWTADYADQLLRAHSENSQLPLFGTWLQAADLNCEW